MSAGASPSAAYARAIFLNKVLLGVCMALVLAIAALAAAIMVMLPLKTTEVIAYEFNNGTQNFVRVHAAGESLRANEPLIDRFLREYVVNREKVDRMTEPERYARVYAMNAPAENRRFRDAYGGKEALVNQEGFSREIRILRSTRLERNFYQIEFQTTDSWEELPNEEPAVNEWVATMAFQFSDQVVSHDERILNPLGLFVARYALSRRGE